MSISRAKELRKNSSVSKFDNSLYFIHLISVVVITLAGSQKPLVKFNTVFRNELPNMAIQILSSFAAFT